MKRVLAMMILIPLMIGALAFVPQDKGLPGKVLVWVRPEEIVRGSGMPSIVFLVANATGRPLALRSVRAGFGDPHIQFNVPQPLPVLTPPEARLLQGILAGERQDFPRELAERVCIMGVPAGVAHDGTSEREVELSATLEFDDGSSINLESTALLTGALPAESGWVAGDGHIHSDFSDGGYSIYQRRNDALNFGYKWILMTDHSGSLGSTYTSYVNTCAAAEQGFGICIAPDQEVSAYEGGHCLAYRCSSALQSGFYYESYLPTYVKNSNSPYSFAGVAHPNATFYWWGDWPRSNPDFRFIELFSNERVPRDATITEWRNQLMVDLPGKIAGGSFTVAVAGSDAHFIGTPYWGKNMTYIRTAMTPPNRTPVYEAILQGKVVASGDGSFGRFKLNGIEIGGVLNASSSTATVEYWVKGVNSSTIIDHVRLRLASNWTIVASSYHAPNANFYQGTKTITLDAADNAYILEVVLHNSSGVTQYVYSNPIFVNR